MNYARIEARYPELDLLHMPLRRVLNLSFEFLMEAHQFDTDGWEKNYAPIFSPEEHGDSDVLDIGSLGRSKIG